MSFASGAQRDLYYAVEDSFGSGPSVLTMTEIRNTEDSLNLVRDNFVSDERRGDRGIHDLRLGNKQPAGDIGFEFSYSEFDRLLPIVLCSDESVVSDDVSATLVASTGVLTVSGADFTADGYAVGDRITISGFSESANNTTYTLSAVGTTTITLTPIASMVDVGVAETIDISAPWTKPYEDLAVTVTADAATSTFTRASGSWITDGVRVGDVITITTFDVEAGNNMTTQVTALTATVMTVSGTVTDAASDGGVFNTTAREIKKGTTVNSIVVEKVFNDTTTEEYQKFTGGILNTLSMEINPNAMITGSLGCMFKDAVNAQVAYHSGTPDSVSDNRPFDGFTGYVTEDDVANTEMSSLSFSLDNGFERNFVLMQNTCPQMTSGKSNVTGSVTLYFENSTVYDKFLNETESALEVGMQDDDLNGYIITFPRIKYTSADIPVNSDGALINTMNFQALDDSTESSNIIIRRQPKAS